MISGFLPSSLRFKLNFLYNESKVLGAILYYQGRLLGAIEITCQLAHHIIFNPAAPVELKLAALGATWLMFEGQKEMLAVNIQTFGQLPLEWQVALIVQVIFVVALLAVGAHYLLDSIPLFLSLL